MRCDVSPWRWSVRWVTRIGDLWYDLVRTHPFNTTRQYNFSTSQEILSIQPHQCTLSMPTPFLFPVNTSSHYPSYHPFLTLVSPLYHPLNTLTSPSPTPFNPHTSSVLRPPLHHSALPRPSRGAPHLLRSILRKRRRTRASHPRPSWKRTTYVPC